MFCNSSAVSLSTFAVTRLKPPTSFRCKTNIQAPTIMGRRFTSAKWEKWTATFTYWHSFEVSFRNVSAAWHHKRSFIARSRKAGGMISVAGGRLVMSVMFHKIDRLYLSSTTLGLYNTVFLFLVQYFTGDKLYITIKKICHQSRLHMTCNRSICNPGLCEQNVYIR